MNNHTDPPTDETQEFKPFVDEETTTFLWQERYDVLSEMHKDVCKEHSRRVGKAINSLLRLYGSKTLSYVRGNTQLPDSAVVNGHTFGEVRQIINIISDLSGD